MSTVKIRRSGTASSTPSSLDHGELAINYADATLFWKDDANVIKSFVFQAYASATHASSHATGGSDALSPSDIGAAPAASPTFTGTVTHSGMVRWEYPDKALDASVSGIGYLRVYDETGFAAGLGVSTASFNVGTQGAINLRFVTNTAERAIITTAGNFGIGTSSPSSLLHVNGVITVSAGTAAAPAIVSTTGTADSGIYWPAADTFAISTAGTERVRVTSGGNVGIGVDPAGSFNAAFDDLVVGTGSGQRGITVYADSASAATLAFADATSGVATYAGYLQYLHGTDEMRIGTSSLPRMYIDSAGNVGLNRTAPASRLDVNGVITVSATSGSAGSYAPSLTVSGDPNTGFGQVSGQSDTASVFTAGHERVRVKSTGAVRFVPLSADPASGEAGDVYYNSSTNKLRVYNGTSWVDLH